MNRKVNLAIFSEQMFANIGEESLSLFDIDFNVNGMYFYHENITPLMINKGEEFIVRINHGGATIEIAKREVMK